jgi:hypothetical protein
MLLVKCFHYWHGIWLKLSLIALLLLPLHMCLTISINVGHWLTHEHNNHYDSKVVEWYNQSSYTKWHDGHDWMNGYHDIELFELFTNILK